MICVSINEKEHNDAIKIASLYNFAEIRLDLLERVDNKIAQKIFSSHKNLIATYRKKDEPTAASMQQADEKRLSILKTAIETGAAYVDIDINESSDFISSIKSFCLNSSQRFGRENTKLIISYHNFEETPCFDFLDKIINQAACKGADIVKIACMVKKTEHVERLLCLPEYYSSMKIVIAGMGKLGGRVRILSKAAGGFFTYASHDMKSCTAEGQLDYKTLLEEQRKIASGW